MKFWCQMVVFLLVGLFAGFTWLMLDNRLTAIDGAIISYVYTWRSPCLTLAMKAISLLGNQVLFITSVAISAFLIVRKRWPVLGRYLLLVVGQEAVNLILKVNIARPRPDYLPLVPETGFSFPSGHSMAGFVFYGALALWLHRKEYGARFRWIWFVVAALMTLSIGISRIYLGVHYPSDVFAGFLAGAIWVMFVLRLTYKAS